MSDTLDIDGSVLEGGGQILRISVSLSAILGIPVKISRIRAGRSKPGLAAQHLKGIQLVAEMCQGRLKGAQIGSTEIELVPGKIRGGHYMADPNTAGSISLLLQVALPCALMADAPVTLDLKGGTNADMAPQIDYMDKIFRHILRKFKADVSINILRRGYFPRGGGHVRAEISPVRNLHSVTLMERGEILTIRGWSFVAGTLPLKLAHEMSNGAKLELRALCERVDIHCYKEERHVASDNCSGILLQCTTTNDCVLGSDALGRRGGDARAAGQGAAARLAADLRRDACLDSHAQDQVILYMALAEGESSIRIGELTLHTKTAIFICEQIAKIKFTVEPDGDQNIISCTGLGFINKNIPK